ncbi:MAG: 4Fe-4S binding protein [Bacteroides sp.]|nr:4Fe-4S binding protein [Bacteroides sp.]
MTPRSQGIFLRTLRTVIAIAVWGLLTWSTVAMAVGQKSMPALAEWLRSVQFIPAAVAFSLSMVIVWVLVTLIFGRVYCSTLCPLGVWQDACARARRLSDKGRRRNHYHFSRALTPWRTVSLGVFLVAIFLGLDLVSSVLEPWTIYSEACQRLVAPVIVYLDGLMDDTAARLTIASTTGAIVSAVLLGGISAVASRHGRTFCNSLCPVGTALGYVSRYSLIHIEIDTDLCTQCRRCEHVCKASCIDLIDHVVDGSRCVGCFDCLTACRDGAIRYTASRKPLSTPMMQRISDRPFNSSQAAG